MSVKMLKCPQLQRNLRDLYSNSPYKGHTPSPNKAWGHEKLLMPMPIPGEMGAGLHKQLPWRYLKSVSIK